MEESLMLVTERRLRQVMAGQLELVRAETEAAQSRPCKGSILVLDSQGSSHTSYCSLVLVRPSRREVGWCLATTESKFGVTLWPVRSVLREGDMKRKTILCHDLHTILAVACWGVGSICRTGSMISSD